MATILKQPAYILHNKPYRNTSLLLYAFTRDHGRVSLISKGAGKASQRSILQPFNLLSINYSGRTSLMSLQDAEQFSPQRPLMGISLMSGFYLNELMINFLHEGDEYENLFDEYHGTIDYIRDINDQFEIEKALRRFELILLNELGYGIDLDFLLSSTEDFSEVEYFIDPDRGVLSIGEQDVTLLKVKGRALEWLSQALSVHVKNVPAINKDDLLQCKKLMRYLIDYRLGGKKLKSREMFQVKKNV